MRAVSVEYKHLYIDLGQPKSVGPGARFSKAPESVRARKAIFRSSVSKNEEM